VITVLELVCASILCYQFRILQVRRVQQNENHGPDGRHGISSSDELCRRRTDYCVALTKLCPVTRDVTPHLRPTASSHPAPSSRGVGAELYCDHASLTLVSADAARWQLKWTADHPRRKGIYRVVPLCSSVTWLYINCITWRKLYHVNFHEIMGIVGYGTSRCGFGILSYTPV